MQKKISQFYWGASTSSHQVEGKTHNSWSEWEKEHSETLAEEFPEKFSYLPENIYERIASEGRNPKNYLSAQTACHYELYPDDIQIMRELHFNAYRFSIEWSRIEPKDGKWDMNEVEHYRKKIQALRKAGIEPFVTLWHWTHPLWFEHQGGWESRNAVSNFVRYVEFITEQLQEEVTYWIILNEPKIYSGMSYLFGEWPPEQTNPIRAYRVLRKLIKAHCLSYDKIKWRNPESVIGVAENIAYIEPVNSSFITQTHARLQEFVEHMFLRKVQRKLDFIGVNYYFRNRIHGMNVENPNEHLSDLGWDLYPQGLYHVLKRLHSYRLPIIVTENGLADSLDDRRQWWLEESMKALEKARNDNIEVFGYLHWSLLDNFEWDKGFWPRFGLVEVNFETLERKVRASARWYAEYIKKHSLL